MNDQRLDFDERILQFYRKKYISKINNTIQFQVCFDKILIPVYKKKAEVDIGLYSVWIAISQPCFHL